MFTFFLVESLQTAESDVTI